MITPASARSLALALLVVAGGSLLLGGLTSVGQTVLPHELVSFANSAGGWTILTFGLVWAVRTRPAPAAILGAVSFVLLVEGYRLVSGWRGFFYAEPFQDTFTLIGLLAGPVVGLAAAVVRRGPATWQPVAVAPVAAVLIGEGVYGLTVVSATTSPVYWVLQTLVGASLAAVVLVRARAGWGMSISGALLTLGGAALFVAFYGSLGSV